LVEIQWTIARLLRFAYTSLGDTPAIRLNTREK
jgi:hypothetical protein